MTELDLERITHPLRLAKGSHSAGSGQGCVMNVVSWLQGDKTITDYPSCVVKPLAALMQSLNDTLATQKRDYGNGQGSFVPTKWSVPVLELGFEVMGTSLDFGQVDLIEWKRRVNFRTIFLGLKLVGGGGTVFFFKGLEGKRRAYWATRIAVHEWFKLAPTRSEDDAVAPTLEQVETVLKEMAAQE